MASLQTTLNTERRNPMLEITLIAVVALWAPLTLKACQWIADA